MTPGLTSALQNTGICQLGTLYLRNIVYAVREPKVFPETTMMHHLHHICMQPYID